MNMPPLNFFRGAIIAMLLSTAAAVIYLSMTALFEPTWAIRITVSAATFGYILCLLSNTDIVFGKLSFVVIYFLSLTILLYWWPSIMAYALYHAGFIWLIRTVYFHKNAIYALADLLFSMLSFTAAVGAIIESQSIFMSFWSFFLTQALILPVLHYVFDKQLGKERSGRKGCPEPEQEFYQAHRNADNALRQLMRNN